MLEVDEDQDGKRRAKRVRLLHVQDRTANTLKTNIRDNVHDEAAIQSDGWKGYQSLSPDFSHEIVNHNRQFVKTRRGKKIHINSLEGCHGVVKRKARALNLLVGQPTKDGEALRAKLGELQFRFNNRSSPDLFLTFLSIAMLKRYKGP